MFAGGFILSGVSMLARLVWSAIATAALVGAAAIAPLAPAATVEGEATFHAESTLGVVKMNATGGKVTGTAEKIRDPAGDKWSAVLECDLAGIDTGIALRNEHMRDKYLEVARFPKAKLVIDLSRPAEWSGTLTIKDEAKPVKGTAAVKDDGTFEAMFTVTLADFPHVGSPEWQGVALAKRLDFTVTGRVK